MSKNKNYYKTKASELRRIQKIEYNESKEKKKFNNSIEIFEEEPIWETAVVEDVSVNGQPLDGSLWDKLFDDIDF